MAEAERHAAQFRPVWDVDEAAVTEEEPAAAAPPAPAAPVAAAPVPAVVVPAGKPTMRWAPGTPGLPGAPAPVPAVTQVSPAFAPPAPVATAPIAQVPPPAPAPGPAPAPRGKKTRAEAPTPEMLDLAGDEAPQISSDGSVALAVVTGPVAVPKASNVSLPQGEPSIVVNDVATMARELEAETRAQEEAEARRRQTIRADDPGLAALQQQYEEQQQAARQQASQQASQQTNKARALRAARTIAPSAGLTSEMVRAAAAAPLPGVSGDDDVDESAFAPPKKNRAVVFGVLGVAGLVALLGVVKVALSGDEPSSGLPTTTSTTAESKPADKGTTTAAPTDATATATSTTTAAPTVTPKATAAANARPTPTLNPSQLPTDTTPSTPAVAATTKKTGGTGPTAAPATAAPAATAKKGSDKGPLVRTAPF